MGASALGRGAVLAAATATVGLLLFAAVSTGGMPPRVDLDGRRANAKGGGSAAAVTIPAPIGSAATQADNAREGDGFTIPPLALGAPYDARRGPPRRFVTPTLEDGVSPLISSAASPQRVWIDCGARGKHGSATAWFMKRNPEASTFHARLFDPIGKGGEYDAATRAFFRSFEYRAAAVSGALPRGAAEGTMAMHGRRMMAPALAQFGPDTGGSEGTATTTTVPAVDFAAWLQARYTEADFVVVKMDIEGGEWEVLAHLIRTGAIRLIDELMLECHRPSARWRVMRDFWASRRLDTATRGDVPVATCGALFHLLSTRDGGPPGWMNCTAAASPCLRRVHRWL